MQERKSNKRKKVSRSKSKPQRLKTFNSSQFSLLDLNNPSFSELFKNEAIKLRQNHLLVSTGLYGSVQTLNQPSTHTKKVKSQRNLQPTKRKVKTKKQEKNRLYSYEVVPCKNSLGSEIIFSHQETVRESQKSQDQSVAIHFKDHLLVDNNKLLRISIKKEYQRKVQAAIKIQKVYRGYLTRKILQKYIFQEQKILSARLASFKSEDVSEHSSYFNDKSKERVIDATSNPPYFPEEDISSEESDDEGEGDGAVYRRQHPIYSHEQISDYLKSSQSEEDFKDAFDENVIFETNEQYIDSRKSSLQAKNEPKNKLSRPNINPIIENMNEDRQAREEIEDVSAQEGGLSKTEKKVEIVGQICSEEQDATTIKMNQESERSRANPQLLETLQYKPFEGNAFSKKNRWSEGRMEVCEMKRNEKEKWEEMITLLKSEMDKSQGGELNQLMQKIMEMSIKNKQSLDAVEPISANQANRLGNLELFDADISDKQGEMIAQNTQLEEQFKKGQTRLDQQIVGKIFSSKPLRKNSNKLQNRPLFFVDEESTPERYHKSSKGDQMQSRDEVMYGSKTMKNFLVNNRYDGNVQQMLSLRQQLLEKTFRERTKKVEEAFNRNEISVHEFKMMMDEASKKHQEDQACVEKARNDITKGYKAALNLTKDACQDARKLGYKFPVSRSAESVTFKASFSDFAIDEFGSRGLSLRVGKQKSIDSRKISEDFQSSSDVEFTQEELSRFRRAKPYDLEMASQIADLNRNVVISSDFARQQMLCQKEDRPLTRQIYAIEEEATKVRQDLRVDLVVEKQIEALCWEFAGELLMKPVFSERLIDKSHFYRPETITQQERLLFITMLEANLPSLEQLNIKLNQKICPSPAELLKCMRIDFSEDGDLDNSYQEVGKYEFIINQEVCNQALKMFQKVVDQETAVNLTQDDYFELEKEYRLGDKLGKYVLQRQKFLENRRKHTRELRWEVMNIEVHTIFDAWNEEIIYYLSQKACFNPIGFNELTLSVQDCNQPLPLSQTMAVLQASKQELIKRLNQKQDTRCKLFDPSLVDDHSKWIVYAQQALSYGLELNYLVEEELLSECARELRRWV